MLTLFTKAESFAVYKKRLEFKPVINITPSISVFFYCAKRSNCSWWVPEPTSQAIPVRAKKAAEVKPSNRRTIKIRLPPKRRAERKLKNSFDGFVFMPLG